MDLENKLKGIPHIYYFNLDSKTNRRDYMESQFKYWGIENYTRISSSKYLASKIDEWVHLIDGLTYNWGKGAAVTANAINHIEAIKCWLESTNDPYMILMEDDYDLSLIEYWHFDWEYLMNNIPYDWDCIQLGYESHVEIKFFLSPKPMSKTYFGPCMINRRYAQKLVDLHYDYDNSKFRVKHKVANMQLIVEGGENSSSVDYFICENGRTYCIPLITTNNDLPSYENDILLIRSHHEISRKLYYDWWQNERDKFTLEDFFTYNKPYDYLMTRKINL
jgi:hypothetical protein